MYSSEPCVIYLNVPSFNIAQDFSIFLIRERLAACVNIIPEMHSVYRWKGQIETTAEVTLLIKTMSHTVQSIIESVPQYISYELPGFITIPITGGNPKFIEWIRQEVIPFTAEST